MISQLLIAPLIFAVVIGKVAICHCGLNGRTGRTIQSGLCLISASVYQQQRQQQKRQQRMVAAEE